MSKFDLNNNEDGDKKKLGGYDDDLLSQMDDESQQSCSSKSQVSTEPETDADETTWDKYMHHLRKTLLCKMSAKNQIQESRPPKVDMGKDILSDVEAEEDMLLDDLSDIKLQPEDFEGDSDILEELENLLKENKYNEDHNSRVENKSPKNTTEEYVPQITQQKTTITSQNITLNSNTLETNGEMIFFFKDSNNNNEHLGYTSFQADSNVCSSPSNKIPQPQITNDYRTVANDKSVIFEEDDYDTLSICNQSEVSDDLSIIEISSDDSLKQNVTIKPKSPVKIAAIKPNIKLDFTSVVTTLPNINQFSLPPAVSTNSCNLNCNESKNPFNFNLTSNETNQRRKEKNRKRKLNRQLSKQKRQLAQISSSKIAQNIKNFKFVRGENKNNITLTFPTNNTETEHEIPLKKLKTDTHWDFLSVNIMNYKMTQEKRKKKNKYSKPINFVCGGIVQAGKKENDNIGGDFMERLKNSQKLKVKSKEVLLEWQKLLDGAGGKIALKMGFIIGKGLGKHLQGITEPIEAHIRKGRGTIGLYGCELSLPTSINTVKQLHMQQNGNKQTTKPGSYSAMYFDYSSYLTTISLPSTYEDNQIAARPFDFSKYNNFLPKLKENETRDNKYQQPDDSNILPIKFTMEQEENNNNIVNFKPTLTNELFQVIISGSYVILNHQQLQNIKNLIEKSVENSIKSCNFCLQFDDVIIQKNSLRVYCANEITQDWIENFVTNSQRKIFNNIDLTVEKLNENNNTQKFKVFIPGPSRMSMEFLRMLENQNPGLKTKQWKIFKRNDVKDGVQLVLGINEKSVKILKNHYNFRPFLGLGRIEFDMLEAF